MANIPTTPFDPAKHVLAGRETGEGREVWFTLGSVVEAERPIEAPHEAAAFAPMIAALRQDIEALKANHPAPQGLASDETIIAVTGGLTDLTKSVVRQKQDHADLAARVEMIAGTLLKIAEKIGV